MNETYINYLNETALLITGCLKPNPLNMVYLLTGTSTACVSRGVVCSTEKLSTRE